MNKVLGRSARYNDGRQVLRDQLVQLAWAVHVAKSTSDVTRQAVFEADAIQRRPQDAPGQDVAHHQLCRASCAGSSPINSSSHGLPTGCSAARKRDRLTRPAAKRAGDQKWSRADLALLDEAEALISGAKQTYGHIVVDEAQDLSAMELRMIARRSRRRSITALGDLAQTTAPGGQTDWAEALLDLGAPEAQLDELTIGYRVPGPIMDFANRSFRSPLPVSARLVQYAVLAGLRQSSRSTPSGWPARRRRRRLLWRRCGPLPE